MNILIVNGYTRQNKGDAALLSVLCKELQVSFPKASLKISSKEDPVVDTHFEEWQNIGSLIQYCFLKSTAGRVGRLLRVLLSIIAVNTLLYTPKKFHTTALSVFPQALRLQLAALLEADLVVSMGGGYLNGGESLRAQGMWAIKMEQVMANVSIYLMLAPLKLAKRINACVVCAPQSMGPFPTRFQKRIVTRTLEKTDLVLTREKKTIKILTELSSNFSIVSSVDSGFLFKTDTATDTRERLGVAPQDLLVGVTVRRWLEPKRQHAYERAVAQTIDHITDCYGATVVFIPQVTSPVGDDDDRKTAKEVYAKIAHKDSVHLLDEQYTHQQIKALYDDLDIIIGTRFHSVIFSLTSQVPALAIEYEHKTSGIMHDLGLDEWVVKIEDATSEVLIHKIDKLIAGKHHYKKHLAKTLPAYVFRAQKAMALIEQTYNISR